MIEPKTTFLALSAALLIPLGVGAQVASTLQAGSLVTSSADGSGLPLNIFRVAPDVLFTGPNATLQSGTSAWLIGQQWQLIDGNVSGTLVSPTIYGVRAELLGDASRAFDDRALGTNQIDVQTRISVPISSDAGMWIGGGVARPWKITDISLVNLMNGGAWTKVGSATISAKLTNLRFTKAALFDSTTGSIDPCVATLATDPAASIEAADASSSGGCTHTATITDLETSVHWESSRMELTAGVGYRFGDDFVVSPDSRRWGTAMATLWVAPRLAIVAGGGRQPEDIERGLPPRTFGTLGMEVAYWPASRTSVLVASPTVTAVRSFDIRPDQDGLEKITIRVGGVEHIEMVGDFTDWQPVALTRSGRDLWQVAVPVAMGVHEINIRVDGGPWFAPPGLPLHRDGYGGQVGMLLITK